MHFSKQNYSVAKEAKEPLSSAINIKTAYNKHMNNFPLIGLGIATKGNSGNTLDTFYPCISFKNGEDELRNKNISTYSNQLSIQINRKIFI